MKRTSCFFGLHLVDELSGKSNTRLRQSEFIYFDTKLLHFRFSAGSRLQLTKGLGFNYNSTSFWTLLEYVGRLRKRFNQKSVEKA